MKTYIRTRTNEASGVNVSGGLLVTNASVEIMTNNADRMFLHISNLDTLSTVFINFGSASASGQGLAIKPEGCWEMGNSLNISTVTAICETTTGANISFMEY